MFFPNPEQYVLPGSRTVCSSRIPHRWRSSNRSGSSNGAIPERICCWTSDAEIGEAKFRHDLWIKEIATVNHNRIAQRLVDFMQIESRELLPIGEHDERVGIFCRSI